MGGKTPLEKVSGELQHLKKDFKFPEKLTIAPGYIHLIRFIRSNRILDIFWEKFVMPMELEYEYVRATIDTAKEQLSIYHDSRLVDQILYSVPKTSLDLSNIDL